jgi:hypothetical protein
MKYKIKLISRGNDAKKASELMSIASIEFMEAKELEF